MPKTKLLMQSKNGLTENDEEKAHYWQLFQITFL